MNFKALALTALMTFAPAAAFAAECEGEAYARQADAEIIPAVQAVNATQGGTIDRCFALDTATNALDKWLTYESEPYAWTNGDGETKMITDTLGAGGRMVTHQTADRWVAMRNGMNREMDRNNCDERIFQANGGTVEKGFVRRF
jgi:hypothetical protein